MSVFTEEELRGIMTTVQGLGSRCRLDILLLLAANPDGLSVNAIVDLLHSKQPVISDHLAKLRESGLVAYRQSGKQHSYYVLEKKLLLLQRFLSLVIPSANDRPAPAAAAAVLSLERRVA